MRSAVRGCRAGQHVTRASVHAHPCTSRTGPRRCRVASAAAGWPGRAACCLSVGCTARWAAPATGWHGTEGERWAAPATGWHGTEGERSDHETRRDSQRQVFSRGKRRQRGELAQCSGSRTRGAWRHAFPAIHRAVCIAAAAQAMLHPLRRVLQQGGHDHGRSVLGLLKAARAGVTYGS
jgi:hypothetical protein